MIKVFALLAKKPGVSGEQFRGHWRDVHAPKILGRPEVERYVQSRILDRPHPGFTETVPYDGMDELWFEDRESAVGALDHCGYLRTEGDSPLDARLVFTRENIVIPGPGIEKDSEVVKGVFLIKHKPGKDREHFQHYWRTKHAPLVPGTPALQRYVQCHVIDGGGAAPDAWDGIGELWFRDFAAQERCWNSREIQVEQLPDTRHFVGPESIGFFVQEARLLWP